MFKPAVLDIAEKEYFELGKDLADVYVFDQLEEKDDLFHLDIKGRFFDIGNPLSYLKTLTVFGIEDKEIGREYKNFLKTLLK